MVSLEQIGIENFKTYNLSGKLFEREEDFIVREIGEDGKTLSIDKPINQETAGEKKDYLLFTLVKRGISTPEAIKLISRRLHISFKRIAYNGNKDKRALTSQRISIFKFAAENLNLDSDRIFFRDVAYSDNPCKIGKLYGNHFTVIVKDFNRNGEDLERIREEISKGVPNFYGPQRFGSSSLNLEVSKNIIKGDFKTAFYDLVFRERVESQLNREKREELRQVFSEYLSTGVINVEKGEETLSKLPGFMYYEKESLKHLMQHKNDYAGAIRIMPKYTRLMILQSYQYYLFNKTLSRVISKNTAAENIPTIGFDLELKEDEISGITQEILKEEGINDLETLKIKSMPEASLKTFMHPSFFIPENFNIEERDGSVVLDFDLKKGSYATILLIKLFGLGNVYG